MVCSTKRIFAAVIVLLSIFIVESQVNDAYAYRCGQSRPCPGGLNPYNPDSYNGVSEHGYNAFGSIGGPSVGAAAQYTKVAHPGQSIVVRYFYDLNPDCSSLGHYEIKLLSQPRGGTVAVTRGANYPNFPQSNVRWVCNQRKSKADQVVYHASASFSGEDSFNIEAISPTHDARRIRFVVTVE